MLFFALGLGCDALFGGSDSEDLLYADLDADGVTLDEGDCDDEEPAMFPGNDESCDSLDNDCDELVDEGVLIAWFFDGDEDDFGAGDPVFNCAQPANYIAVSGDCDDGDPGVNPDAEEICDDVDQDCDDAVDEGVLFTWFSDTDADGYGAGEGAESCEQPSGSVDNDYDCDDSEATVNPAASDGCNAVDDDCDEEVDEEPDIPWYRDEDGDGYGDAELETLSCEAPSGYVEDATDCDDEDAAINPETEWFVDDDNDGFGQADISTVQCEQPAGHVLDATDCDGAEPSIYPGATEECDEIDEDCDALIDEGVATTYYADTDADGYGDASSSTDACAQPSGYTSDSSDCDDSDGDTFPGATETCDDDDDDCDSAVDEDASDASTWYADSDSDSYGDPSSATSECDQPSGYVDNDEDCDDSTDEVSPDDTESCNSVDDDCDGSTDEGVTTTYYADTDGDGYGDADSTSEACSVPSGYTTDSSDCDDGDSAVSPAETEVCSNGIDDDCDGGPGDCGVSGTYDMASSAADYDVRFWGSAASDKMGGNYNIAVTESLIGDTTTNDLLIGAPGADPGGASSGAVWVFDGPVTSGGEASSVATEQLAGGQYDNCASLASGDYDGDGTLDLAVGCRNLNNGSWTPGAVQVAYGPLTTMNLASSADASIWGSTSTSQDDFGEFLVSSDFNGDGTSDLLIGASGYKSGSNSYAGRASIVHGPFSATHTAADGTLDGYTTSDYLGDAVAVLPDTNGDGLDDVAIGSHLNDSLGASNGSAYVMLGPATGTLTADNTSAVTDGWLRGDEGGEYFGWSLTGADFDGDGYGDLAVGAPYWGTSYHGQVTVFLGPVTGTTRSSKADIEITGDESGYRDGLGYAMTTGDFDDDGNVDLIVGCLYGYNSSNQPGGVAYVFAGPLSSGDATIAAAKIDSAANGDHLGEGVAAGDADGDGIDDVLIGAPWIYVSANDDGAVYLLSGGSL